jgi:hypothetical protein
MRVAEVIRAAKVGVDAGSWKTGHITRAEFPLSRVRSRRYKLGSEYRWRVVKFNAIGNEFRVLIELNENKEIYRATLGRKNADDIAVICQHEFHKSETGWHCHVSHDEIDTLPAGVMRSSLLRWPKPSLVHAQVVFPVSERTALSVAAARFRFLAQGDLL